MIGWGRDLLPRPAGIKCMRIFFAYNAVFRNEIASVFPKAPIKELVTLAGDFGEVAACAISLTYRDGCCR